MKKKTSRDEAVGMAARSLKISSLELNDMIRRRQITIRETKPKILQGYALLCKTDAASDRIQAAHLGTLPRSRP